MIYLQLFQTFFIVGLFGFGGGYGATALMQDLIVTERGWLTMKEFADVITVSEMTPGPMGINIASFVGVRVAGIAGTAVSTMSYVLPSAVIVMVLARFYMKYRQLKMVQQVLKGLQPAVCALSISAAVRLAVNAVWAGNINFDKTNWIAAAMCAVLLVMLRKKRIAPIPAIFASGVVGAVLYGIGGM